MLFNVVDFEDGLTVEDVEVVLSEICNVVKNKYGDERGGFIADQVFRNSGCVSEEGTVAADDSRKARRVNRTWV